ncbi:MAG: proton-conducting transporter membrane subunit, partial [Halobacteria archaeon]|nr:proton-conducting transporter membrane subunit [Halobacteria archaeon]
LYGLSSLLMITFVLKAGAVPLHFWVPETYPAAPAPVSAILAGVVKKVGVYGILRVFGTVLVPLGDFYSPVVLVIAVASALYGGWAALSRDDILEMLSYSSIAQVGFIFLGASVGLNSSLPETVRVLAFTAVLIYSLNHAVIKSMLFLVAGHISRLAITTRFDQLGGLSKRAPIMSYSFFLGSIALIGVPPLNGFFGKLLVFDAGVDAHSSIVVGVALASAILTILYLSRTWSLAFWSQEGDASYEVTEPQIGILIPIVVLTLLCIGIGVFFDPVFEYAKGAAQATVDTQAYIDAVLVGGIL